jgi:hypothetical protein
MWYWYWYPVGYSSFEAHFAVEALLFGGILNQPYSRIVRLYWYGIIYIEIL